jgi:hypothetical protein
LLAIGLCGFGPANQAAAGQGAAEFSACGSSSLSMWDNPFHSVGTQTHLKSTMGPMAYLQLRITLSTPYGVRERLDRSYYPNADLSDHCIGSNESWNGMVYGMASGLAQVRGANGGSTVCHLEDPTADTWVQ